MSATTRKIAALLLLLFGVEIWLTLGHGQYAALPRFGVMASLIFVTSLPPVFRRISALLDRLRHPSARNRAIASALVFALASLFLIWTGFHQQRDLFPKYHDEHMHLLQARMLSQGRLWMPQHPAADSLESFHILVKPVYASIYFPGTALVYAPAAWLNLPYWLMPALVSGACAAMLFAVTAELFDAVYGGLAALLLVSLIEFRHVSLMEMSHSVMAMIGLTLLWAWLRWRSAPSLAWAAAIGALGGMAAITRPVDALCYSTPVAFAMLWTMRSRPLRDNAAAIALILLCAAPFLALQVALNRGVTGQWLQTPYHFYCQRFTPQMTFGFHDFDPRIRPQTTLEQRVVYYDSFTVPAAMNHRAGDALRQTIHERLPLIIRFGLPAELLIILLPAGLLALHGGRAIFAAVLALFAAMYALFAYLLPHYSVIVAPALIVMVLAGMHALCAAFPRQRAWLVTSLTAIVVTLALRGMPQFNRLIRDDPFSLPTMTFNHRLPDLLRAPALVLYRYDRSDDANGEPVYNVDAAWPDDAPIVRAHERDREANIALIDYFARRQPLRNVYRVDRAHTAETGYRPQFLGTAADLARSGYNPATQQGAQPWQQGSSNTR